MMTQITNNVTTAGTDRDGEDWVSVEGSSEYIEIQLHETDLADIDMNGQSMSSEEYTAYLKRLWSKDRENRQRLMNKEIDRNNALKEQLNVIKKQNIELQNELKFVNSKVKHQQNNAMNIDEHVQTNVVSKIWNVFKPKASAQQSNLQKLQQMSESIHNARVLDSTNINNYKRLMNECMDSLLLQIENLSKSITIK
eukprot:1161676_1